MYVYTYVYICIIYRSVCVVVIVRLSCMLTEIDNFLNSCLYDEEPGIAQAKNPEAFK